MPALLTKASMRPKASQASWTEFWMVGPSAHTSSSTATALRILVPSTVEEEEVGIEKSSWLIWSQRDLRRSIRRAAATIKEPDLARSRHNSRPRPEDAPVTMTTLPCRSSHGSMGLDTWLAIVSLCHTDGKEKLSK